MTKEGLTSHRAQPGPRDPVPLPLDLPTYRDDEHHTGYCQRVDAAESIHNRFGRCHVLVFRPNNDDVRLHAYAMCQGSHSLRTSHGEQSASEIKAAAFVTSAGCGEATMTSAHQRQGHASCYEHTTVQPSAKRSLLPRQAPSSGWSTSALRQRLEFLLLCESVCRSCGTPRRRT